MGVVGHGLSTAARAWKTPVPGQRACCHHHGRLPTRSVRSNSSRVGRSTQLSPGRFEGVVTATTWGNRHGVYRRPHLEDARSGATRLCGGGSDGEIGVGGEAAMVTTKTTAATAMVGFTQQSTE